MMDHEEKDEQAIVQLKNADTLILHAWGAAVLSLNANSRPSGTAFMQRFDEEIQRGLETYPDSYDVAYLRKYREAVQAAIIEQATYQYRVYGNIGEKLN